MPNKVVSECYIKDTVSFKAASLPNIVIPLFLSYCRFLPITCVCSVQSHPDLTTYCCYFYLLQANVICIVYSVNSKKSIEKVGVFFFFLCFLKHPIIYAIAFSCLFLLIKNVPLKSFRALSLLYSR